MSFRMKGKTQLIIIIVSFIIFIAIVRRMGVRYKFDDTNVTDDNGATEEVTDLKSSENLLSFRYERPVMKHFVGEKLVHLDLKGAPPLLSYFKEFLPFVKSLGATGLLIEYEDMFPYHAELDGIKALNAYSPSDIKAILYMAEVNELSVIPLVQVFGHLEFILKLKEYRELREVDAYPEVVCPNNKKVLPLVQKMIDQVMEAHPKAAYIHLGCDKINYLGKCEKCAAIMNSGIFKENNLFLNHIVKVGHYIQKKYPKVRPIVWSDMFDKVPETLVETYQIPSLLDVMIWKHSKNVSADFPDKMWRFYGRLFKSVWIASAFKGVTGSNNFVTYAGHHLTNHRSWMEVINKWQHVVNFKGIALTGRQRYDHFALLCEFLPVAIPSLTLSLQYLRGSEKELNRDTVLNILQCDSMIPFSPRDLKYVKIPTCNFPGYPVYRLISKFYIIYKNVEELFQNAPQGWFSVYQYYYKFSNPSKVEHLFETWPFEQLRTDLSYLEEELKRALSEVYDEHTVQEWILTYVLPLRLRLDAVYTVKDVLLEQEVWPRRPFFNKSDLIWRSAKKICSYSADVGCGFLIR